MLCVLLCVNDIVIAVVVVCYFLDAVTVAVGVVAIMFTRCVSSLIIRTRLT